MSSSISISQPVHPHLKKFEAQKTPHYIKGYDGEYEHLHVNLDAGTYSLRSLLYFHKNYLPNFEGNFKSLNSMSVFLSKSVHKSCNKYLAKKGK